MDNILEVKNLTKVYKTYKNNFDRLKEIFTSKKYHKEFIANKNISFELKKGETLGIIGVNGAGKSTLLKMIAGIIAPTSGEIHYGGRVTALLELGTGFNQELTGYENIFLNAKLIGMTKEQIRVNIDNIVEFSELGDYINQPIKSYSTGMVMRLAFSIAIFSQPQILIVDEALSVGDAHFSAKCTRALKEKKEQNLSIIYVSHDLNSLKLLCDRLILLDKGTIIKVGTPEQVINSYNFLIAKLNDKQNAIDINKEEKSSFGTFDVEIKSVKIEGAISKTNTLYSGEKGIITINIDSKKDLKDMTIGILIKDRFSQDIFGTNTFHQNLKINFQKDKSYKCIYSMPINLGVGNYTITVAVHSNDVHLHNCSHWLDYATDFKILGSTDYNFTGICKLEPKITFKEVED